MLEIALLDWRGSGMWRVTINHHSN